MDIKDFISFENEIQEADFKSLLKSAFDVQEALNRIDGRRAASMMQYFSIYGDQSKAKKEIETIRQERTILLERIQTYTESLSKSSHKKNRQQLQFAIAQDQFRVKRIEERLKRKDPADILIDKTEFKTNHMYANGLDQLAERIGNWFASGVIGPGTVTYREKSFTAKE
jgi:chromosome segregation ATPase